MIGALGGAIAMAATACGGSSDHEVAEQDSTAQSSALVEEGDRSFASTRSVTRRFWTDTLKINEVICAAVDPKRRSRSG